MKIRNYFVANSSSASFIVEVPISDKKVLFRQLFENFEFFDKNYLLNKVKSYLESSNSLLQSFLEEKKEFEKLSAEEQNSSKLKNYYTNESETFTEMRYKSLLKQLEKLENIDMLDFEKLVQFGLDFFHIYLEENPKKGSNEIESLYLASSVTMHNDFGDIPNKLRSLVGGLAFMYPIKCWVDDEY